MKQIKIRFITEGDFISEGIRFVTHAPQKGPTHAEFILEDGTMLGARAVGGVAIRPADYCTPTWERRYAINVSEVQYDKILDFAEKQIGKPYDFVSILGILVDTDWHNKTSWFCSELVLACLEEADIYPLNVLSGCTYRIDPDKLHLSPIFIGKCYDKSNG